MAVMQSSEARMFDLGQELLTKTKSIVRFLGLYRSHHPEWEMLELKARKRLRPRAAELAARMERALARLERAQTLGLIEHERDQLERGTITIRANHEMPLRDELLRLGLAEWTELDADEKGRLGDEDTHKLTFRGTPAQHARAADELVTRAQLRYRRAQAVAIGREKAAMPAVNVAEHAEATTWLKEQSPQLHDMHAEFDALVTDHAIALPGLVDIEGQRFGKLRSSSASGLLTAATRSLLERLESNAAAAQANDLDAIDWEDLGIKLECELAELARRQQTQSTTVAPVAVTAAEPKALEQPPEPAPTLAVDFAFQRILVDAAGEHLTFTQIFVRAKAKHPDLFPMAKVNSRHEIKIRGLSGGRTQDGWLIRENDGGRGRRREFWAEKVAEAEAT
ncbi:MAG: hypothetical protein ACON4Z_07600 [Planctomycetota bacterium]